ncbi:AAA family ATPase [Paraburkholderia tuberum]|uniref:ATPase family associated with various cellular activities (AAA) n=1 Tax=Paraburkholderia tuberum TaxID=157910 RepID=A0A1H1CXF7_9BURK|nr:ATP-binding protein [Paraburkholderia tuberum]SDQ68977.1 ATPase family associated with various cellular activities (AAA) [Paraburkholderia tuberum]
MEHFPIIQALCRAALAGASPALRKQVERLRDALNEEGQTKQAASLTGLIVASERNVEVAPSKLTASRGFVGGEVLTPNTLPPVDRETSAPLAEIIFPSSIQAEPPLFNAAVTHAVGSVIEELANADAFHGMGVQPARTCLIFGPPGTGKTRLALWMARELNLPVVLVKLDGLISSFLGTTARNIANLFAFANRYQCLLLLDEFDAIAKVRDDPQEVGEIKRVVNALLQNLDLRKENGFTIGITNHARLLDSAVWRRFEVQLEIPKPEFDIRIEIARAFMAPLTPPSSHLRLIAWFTQGASGAEIEMLVRTYKKASVVNKDSAQGLLDTLQQFATRNAARVEESRRALLFSEPGTLFRAMKSDPDLNFSLADIGEVAGRDKSTVSRQIGKPARSIN